MNYPIYVESSVTQHILFYKVTVFCPTEIICIVYNIYFIRDITFLITCSDLFVYMAVSEEREILWAGSHVEVLFLQG